MVTVHTDHVAMKIVLETLKHEHGRLSDRKIDIFEDMSLTSSHRIGAINQATPIGGMIQWTWDSHIHRA